LGRTTDYEIGMCVVFAKHTALTHIYMTAPSPGYVQAIQ